MIDESHLLSHSSKTTTSSPTMISSTKTKREVIVIAHVVSIVVCAKYLTSKKLQLILKKNGSKLFHPIEWQDGVSVKSYYQNT